MKTEQRLVRATTEDVTAIHLKKQRDVNFKQEGQSNSRWKVYKTVLSRVKAGKPALLTKKLTQKIQGNKLDSKKAGIPRSSS